MTWVVAGRHLFCARCLADVQVTLKAKNVDTVYIDAVQKVHKIGPDLVVAFADSVRLGFYIIDKLKFDFYPKLNREFCVNSELVLREIFKYLKDVVGEYEKLSAMKIPGYVPERVELMVLFQPILTADMFRLPPKEFPFAGVWKIEIPSFKVWEPAKSFQLLELGFGSQVDDYREIVERHEQGFYVVPGKKGELPSAIIPSGKVALELLFAEAKQYQNAGISKAMHVALLSADGVFTRGISESFDIPFPSVVDNWVDFKKLMKGLGIGLTDFTATA